MSYCRFGSDEGKSDVYCLGCSEGYETIVTTTLISFPNNTFIDETLEGFKARLLGFRKIGYHVPQEALDRINRELVEE